MSVPALNWAFDCDVRGPAKAVLIVLANHAGEDGRCWPSLDRIAAHAGLAKRTVQDAVRALAAAGWIVDEGPTGHRSTTYRVTMAPRATVARPATVAADATVARPATVADGASPQWQEAPQNSGASRHLTINEPSDEPSSPKPPNGVKRGADLFDGEGEGAELPAWVPVEPWNRFVAHRKAIRKPMTPGAAVLTVKKLDEMRGRGVDIGAALDESVMQGWRGVFEPRADGGGRKSERERNAEWLMGGDAA